MPSLRCALCCRVRNGTRQVLFSAAQPFTPPAALQQGSLQVQAHRFFGHRQYMRWPPHINLLWPFVEDAGEAFADAGARVAELARRWQLLQV